MLINRLNTADSNFTQRIRELLRWEDAVNNDVNNVVSDILARIRTEGDDALVEFTNRFDHRNVKKASEFIIESPQLKEALERIPKEQADALWLAAERIELYHLHQKQESWQYTEDNGTVLGQKVTPLDRVGLYAPGGKAAYPSSILMAALPAKVAGVPEVVLVTPTPNGDYNDIVLAAAAVAGVSRVVTIGGAQAIGALAYGTATIPKVDKIVGPGNIYVSTAKRQVFGAVDIDMIAGPSEILIVCDGLTDPDWVAMDLFSQAEHDENAQAILICPDTDYLNRVEASIEKLLPTLSRADIASVSLKNRGALIEVKDMAEAVQLANYIAPEHLELSVENPETLVDDIRHAGAIFMGRHTSESLGDYCAGPNHVLPTSGTARFSSPLGVYDYVKRSSIIHCSEQGASELGKIASILARSERLEAHARSAEYRIKK
ncbi:histidinol dehydrogenase [Teredinibacter purpureus]|jgi:histidinol dehydrogenase (EC 1.1.1.23)|uniref:histidinol dehydrogenase n=1 Tax=Teredinibacter purpureus TaxID=2731756 RepID=UPI0005F8564B|nr:histidinol dehydrogenase [Teredinibacter purpureus]